MPLSRYQIRNEYSLADPELYRAAEKDDPEALLEGVAMAGLVGVLRQLGDLAEFAAELFHDLHEEVMVTAARGHSLIVRVQQLEAEIPAVEKAFLSQTSHSSFLYNPGIVWHPKIRMENSLILSGDLPRFIMDSYEECRGPPRLFLLDKFDVAGAGACLKRYTDPSFFKLESSSSGTSGIDIQRERKIRKAKKKGSRWRNGETPEVLSMSHAKLHQLFLEERIENGITDPARRVKLRKRLNGFPFDTKSGKSYMERFLKSASGDHNEVHDIPVDSSPLLLLPNGRYEPVSEIAKIKTMTPENESKERFTSPLPLKKGTYQIDLPAEKLNEIASGTGLSDVLTSDSSLQAYNVRDPCFEAYNVSSTPQVGNSGKVFPVDGGSSESVGDYKSDDIASEVEQYMDALTTIESEIDTDTELKAKSKLGYFNGRKQVSDFYVNDDQIQAISSESQSLGNSTLSDDGNSSSKKGISIVSSSDTQSPVPSDVEVSSIVFPCNHQLEVHDTTSVAQFAVAVKSTVSQAPGGAVSDDASTGIAEYPRLSSKLDNLGSDSVPLDLTTFHKSADSLTGKAPVGPEADKTLANMSLDTATTYTAQPPARDDPPSRVCCYNHFMDGFEVENHETGRNLCYSSCPCCPSNSKDESSFKEMLDDYGNKIDSDYQIFDENVASISCFLAVPVDATNGNIPTHANQNEMNELEGKNLILSPKASLQSNISDVALRPREDSSPEMSGRNTPTVELDSLQPNSFVDIVTAKSYGRSLNCMLEARSAEDHHGHNLDEGRLGQQRVVFPFAEEHHLDPVAAEVDNNCPSTGEMTLNATSETNIGRESVVYVVQNVVANLQSEQLKQGTSDSEEEHSERPSNTVGAAIMKREASCDLDLFETNCTSSPSLVGENFTQVHFSVPDSGAEREIIEMTHGATAKKAISSELVSTDSELVSDVPFIHSKQEISSSEKEHFERPSDVEIAAFWREAGCNFNHLEVDSLSIPSLLGDNVQVHLAVPFVSAEREAIEDADGSLVDLKNSVEESLPAFEDEYTGPEAEKASPLEEPLKLCVAHNLHYEKLDPPDSISALSDVDDIALSDHKRSADTLGRYFASDNMHSDNNISVRSPAKRGEWEASFGEENFDSVPWQLDEAVPIKVQEELLTQARMQGSEETDCATTSDASSEPMLESLSSQPLVSECLSQESNNVDVPGTMDFPKATLSNSFLLPSTSHVTVEEMPPLPPLPPVQWRLTKLQHALPAQERLSVQHNAKSFSPLFQSRDGQDTQLLNVVTGQSNLDFERSSSVSEHATEEVAHSCQSLTQMATVPGHGDSKEEDEAFVPHLPAIGASENPYGEYTKFRNQTASRASSTVDDELRQWSECTTSQQPSMTEKDQPQHAVSTTEGPLLWRPAVEDEHHKENGSVHMKLPRPRNPLIDAVVALDKSKLRKVTEHVRSEVEKVDDRDSILEQIRTKSFNLKPAVVSRPSIQGPATNLKVAAILEKAKTIRQAFVGSDEDDDNDSWSDS